MNKSLFCLNIFMKGLLLFIAATIVSLGLNAQISKDDFVRLQQMEDSMKSFAATILQGRNVEDRLQADSIFTRMLVRALKTDYSFYFPFDSLVSISKLVPQDKTFKIFSWQLVINDNTIRKHGAIQINTADGKLKLFPLIDKSSVIKDAEDSIGDNLNWIGAVYYKLVETESFGKKYYTLLGYDENNIRSDRKIIEILTFKNGMPVFGGRNFSFPEDGQHKKGLVRFIMTYKKYASPRLTFDPELNMIVMEHMISETGEPNKKYTYIPDGDYEGMKWKDGKWVYVNKIFTYVTPKGEEPVPHPILDEKGKIDETKLKNNQQ